VFDASNSRVIASVADASVHVIYKTKQNHPPYILLLTEWGTALSTIKYKNYNLTQATIVQNLIKIQKSLIQLIKYNHMAIFGCAT